MRKMISESPVLKNAAIEIKSAAVLNKSKVIFPKAVVSLQNEGFSREEILAHRPSFKWCDMQRFRDADVIIGMSKMHKLLTPYGMKKKYVSLSEAATGEYSMIPDPFLAKSQEEYDKCMAVIKNYVGLYVQKLEKQFI